ncbi:uncharacterized protein LOC144088599 [Stigmatopora argus]
MRKISAVKVSVASKEDDFPRQRIVWTHPQAKDSSSLTWFQDLLQEVKNRNVVSLRERAPAKESAAPSVSEMGVSGPRRRPILKALNTGPGWSLISRRFPRGHVPGGAVSAPGIGAH